MMQSCSSCDKCVLDTKALDSGVVIDKCQEFGFHVLHPLFSGWSCPRYERRKGVRLFGRRKGNG